MSPPAPAKRWPISATIWFVVVFNLAAWGLVFLALDGLFD